MAVIIDNRLINSTGYLKTFGVSADHTQIDWGDMYTETDYTHQVVITNIGNTAGVLSMTTEPMPTGMTLTWDAEGYALGAFEAKTVTFTLRAANGTLAGQFMFGIIVSLTA